MASLLCPFTDLISLEEAENILDAGVVGQALHPHQSSWLRQHRRGDGCVVGLGRHGCCHCSWWRCKVADGGRRNRRAGQGEESQVRRDAVPVYWTSR